MAAHAGSQNLLLQCHLLSSLVACVQPGLRRLDVQRSLYETKGSSSVLMEDCKGQGVPEA